MRISDWSSDVCSSDLIGPDSVNTMPDDTLLAFLDHGTVARTIDADPDDAERTLAAVAEVGVDLDDVARVLEERGVAAFSKRSEEHTSELQSLMRISYAVFCLKKKINKHKGEYMI